MSSSVITHRISSMGHDLTVDALSSSRSMAKRLGTSITMDSIPNDLSRNWTFGCDRRAAAVTDMERMQWLR
ncbi:MAG: hypothetical protein AAF268_16055 [Cyanobacteria bacterium P01_A01_bin.3]